MLPSLSFDASLAASAQILRDSEVQRELAMAQAAAQLRRRRITKSRWMSALRASCMVGLGLLIGLSVNSDWIGRGSASTDQTHLFPLASSGPEPPAPEASGVDTPTLLPAQAASEGQAMMIEGGLPTSIPSIVLAARMPPLSSLFSATPPSIATKSAPVLGPVPFQPASGPEGRAQRVDPGDPGPTSTGKMPLAAVAETGLRAPSASAGPPLASTSNSSGGRTNFLEFSAEVTPGGDSSGGALAVDQARPVAPSSQSRSPVEYRVLSVPVEGVAMVQTDLQKSVRPIRVGERLPDGSVLKRADVATGKVETSR